MPTVPQIVGLTKSAADTQLLGAGLVVGTVTPKPSIRPAGEVLSATPAVNTVVPAGTAVNLDVSSGQIAVPDVTGFTRTAAEAMLKSAGLTVGTVTSARSASTPSGGVSSTNPAPGAMVNGATAVALEISSGDSSKFAQVLALSGAWAVALLGVVVVVALGFGIFGKGDFLQHVANTETARGLITFLIVFSTVGIALILTISTVVTSGGANFDKQFDQGKQVLTSLLAITGTIVGFYYGATKPDVAKPPLKITTSTLEAGKVNTVYKQKLESAGGTPPIVWSVAPALPAGLTLDEAGNLSGTPTAPLPKKTFEFTATDKASPPATTTMKLELEIKP